MPINHGGEIAMKLVTHRLYIAPYMRHSRLVAFHVHRGIRSEVLPFVELFFDPLPIGVRFLVDTGDAVKANDLPSITKTLIPPLHVFLLVIHRWLLSFGTGLKNRSR
jgi:hypothetical protein